MGGGIGVKKMLGSPSERSDNFAESDNPLMPPRRELRDVTLSSSKFKPSSDCVRNKLSSSVAT